jgi:hypothetical protein
MLVSTSLLSIANMVSPNTIPAVVTTPLLPPNARTSPVRMPALACPLPIIGSA